VLAVVGEVVGTTTMGLPGKEKVNPKSCGMVIGGWAPSEIRTPEGQQSGGLNM